MEIQARVQAVANLAGQAARIEEFTEQSLALLGELTAGMKLLKAVALGQAAWLQRLAQQQGRMN